MRYKFIDKHGYGGPYVYIHPYKQQSVKQIVEYLAQLNPDVEDAGDFPYEPKI